MGNITSSGMVLHRFSHAVCGVVADGKEGIVIADVVSTAGFFFWVQTKGELAHPVHHVVLETTSRNQGSELSSSMIPQKTVVADLARSDT